MPETALIAGLGPGFCERLAERLARDGYRVGLFGRSEGYLEDFAADLRDGGHEALAVPTDVTDPDQVAAGVEVLHDELGPIEVVAHTASTVTMDDRSGIDPDRFEALWRLYALGGLLCVREALDDLRETGGTVLFFGSGSDGGDVAYNSGKAAARGLARSLADTYGPQGIHVAHVVIAGIMLNPDVRETVDDPDPAAYLDPAAVAETCLDLIDQDAQAWTLELDVRPHTQGLS